MRSKTLIALAATLLSAPAFAGKPPQHAVLGVEAKIPFAGPNISGDSSIRNFEADGDDGIYLQDNRRLWYYADLGGGCFDLPHAITIGIDTRGTSALDKFGAILVDGRSCQIESLVTSAPPPTKAEKKAARKAKTQS